MLVLALALVTAAAEPARVEAARAEKLAIVQAAFEAAGVPYPPREVLLRSFKTEGKLELWATGRTKDPLVLIKKYDVCAASGELGPKREMGDLQVPEGFYSIDALNAWSTFHLSLHVDYPNAADIARGAKTGVKHLGGQIMVHGNCVTIGCIPIEDEFIKEVYLVMKDARIRGARTPIHIFPRRLDDAGLTALLASDAPDDVKHLWRELAEGYRAFEATHRIPRVRVDENGRYVVTTVPGT